MLALIKIPSLLPPSTPIPKIIFCDDDVSTNNLPVTNKRNIVTRAYNYFLSDVIERNASVGTPSAIQSSELGRKVIDIQKQVRGQLAPKLDEVLRITGKGFGEKGKVITNLSDFEVRKIGGN